MSLFETIIGIAERSWRNKPRKDTVKAFVSLRSAMLECQQRYEDHKASLKLGRDAERTAAARSAWLDSVQNLGSVIAALNPVLQILSPETYHNVVSYHASESGSIELRGYDLDFDWLAEELHQTSDIDHEHDTLKPGFKPALERLDAFIKENFKVEEIYAAQPKSPHP
jgi:hypothetical protein